MIKEDMLKYNRKKWIIYGSILFIILISGLFYDSFNFNNTSTGNVAVISINGMIEPKENLFDSKSIEEKIYEISSNNNVRALILKINSGGGTPVESHRIAMAINYFQSKNKTVVSLIGESANSGAYMIASASDYIFVDDFSLVGSVGVRSGQFVFDKFLEDYNISYESYSSGEFKDLGDPFQDVSESERDYFMSLTKKMHEKFLDFVLEQRPNIKIDNINKAQIYLGDDSVKLNLTDEIGSINNVYLYLENELNSTISLFELKAKYPSFFDYIFKRGFSNSNLNGLLQEDFNQNTKLSFN